MGRLINVEVTVGAFPRQGRVHRTNSGMVLSGHSDSAYLNVRKSCSRAGAHIMLSEDTPVPARNVPVLTVTQIIKLVISSAAEAEISGLFICVKAMVQFC